MKHRALLLTLAALSLAFAGCTSSRRAREFPAFEPRTNTPEPITLKTVGPPGQQFTLALSVDGQSPPQQITGVTPAAYPLTCVVLTGEVTHHSGDGPFSFEVERANGNSFFTIDSSGSGNGRKVSRFRYHDGTIEALSTEQALSATVQLAPQMRANTKMMKRTEKTTEQAEREMDGID